MKVKNISGVTRYFSFGVRGAEISAGGVHTIIEEQDISQVFGAAVSYVEQGLLEILEGPKIAQYTANTTFAASGNVYITQPPQDGNTITVGNSTYEFDDNGDVASGNVAVDVSGSLDIIGRLEQLKTTVNSNTFGNAKIEGILDVQGNVDMGNVVIFTAKEPGPSGNTLALSADPFSVSSDTLTNGCYGSVSSRPAIVYEVTHNDIVQGSVYLSTGLKAITAVIVQARSADNQLKFFDGTVQTSGGIISVGIGSGKSTLDSGDKLTIIVSE